MILANSPILNLLGIPTDGLSEEQLRESVKKLRLLRTSAPALKKALEEETEGDEEVKEKASKKSKKKKDDQKTVDGLLGEYGV